MWDGSKMDIQSSVWYDESMESTIEKGSLQKIIPAAFYRPNKAADQRWILDVGGMPGSRSQGDRPWFESLAKLRCSVGGNRAGKTTKLVLETGSFCVGCRPWYSPENEWFTKGIPKPPVRCRYVIPNFKTHLPEVIKEFTKWWPNKFWDVTVKDRGLPTQFTFFNGSTIDFMSHHMQPEDFEGIESDLNTWDEPPPRRLWTALQRGLVSRSGRAILGATLLDASGWFWDEIIDKADKGFYKDILVTWHSIWDNTAENGGCPTQLVENVRHWLETDVTDPDERLAREHGAPMHVGGLVLKDFTEERNIVDPFDLPESAIIVSCIDPAGSRPFAGLHIAYLETNDGGWEGHLFDETYLPTQKNDLGAFCDAWKAKEAGKEDPVHPTQSVITLIDPFANEPQKADAMGRTMRDILEEDYGISTVDADRRNKKARLMTLNSRVREGKYKVWSHLRRLLSEIRRWSWDPESAKLVKGPDDVSDCWSYIDHADPPSNFMHMGGQGDIYVPKEYMQSRESKEAELRALGYTV